MDLPLILAGPILRRVEPRLVAVWIALRESRTVRLSIWRDLQDTGPGTDLFSGRAPEHSAEIETRRIGEQLHIAVVTVKIAPAPAPPLLPGQLYSYNVTLSDSADLKSLGLLENGPLDGRDHLALGYQPKVLPGFALCPMELTDLRLLHGSCRRINHDFEDGLAWVDELIRESRADPFRRPHQLFLSGDQIYADDVALPMLPQMIERAGELLGNAEFLPTIWPEDFLEAGNGQNPTYWPADEKHFPPAIRHRLIDSEARFTTSDSHSHVISFGEFAALYLFSWSNALWEIEKLRDFNEIDGATKGKVKDLFPNWGAIFRERDETGNAVLDGDELEKHLDFIFETLETKERLKALKTEEYAGKKGHLEDGKAKPPVDPGVLTKKRLEDLPEAKWALYKKIYDYAVAIAGQGTPEESRQNLKEFQHLFESLQEAFGGLYKKEFREDRRKPEVERFYETLPQVRRALANVPTYMMFDDHEVTDDWYLNPLWRDRVLTAPLGRTVIRNGLLSYALFQGWGNDPARFEDGAHAKLLREATRLFPAGQTRPTRESDAAGEIDRLLGLNGGDPPVHWHYTVDGARHRVLALDNRTRRSFVSRIGPPGNIALAEMEDQVPDGPLPAGLEVLVVVAPLPVLGPPIFDEIIAPLVYRAFDLKSYITGGKAVKSGMAGTNPDAIEAWVFDPHAFEALLERLEPYRRVVLLSGDVHYGSSQAMSYWTKEDTEPARFAQFTSSGLRNVMPAYIQALSQSFGFLQLLVKADIGTERLGWDREEDRGEEPPAPLVLPAGTRLVPQLRAKLQHTPVLLTTQGLPEDTRLARAPDWQWRLKVVRDQREETQRPKPAQLETLPDDAELTADPKAAYGKIAAGHAKHLTKLNNSRQILFAPNLGSVQFEQRGEDLYAVGQLYSMHSDDLGSRELEVYDVHEIALTAAGEEKPSAPLEVEDE